MTTFSFGPRHDHVLGKAQMGKFDLPNQEIVVYELLKKIGSKYVFFGLGFDMYVESKTKKQADILAAAGVNILLCLFCYSTLASWQDLLLIENYDASKGTKRRDFSFFYYPEYKDILVKSIRLLPLERFSLIWNTAQGKANDNVFSSIYQLNNSFQVNDKKEEFIYLWLGLEYIASVLNEKYRSSNPKTDYPECRFCKQSIKACPHCDHTFAKKAGRFDGVIKVAIEKLGISKKEFSQIYEVRSKLMHNSASFSPKNYIFIDTLRRLLVWCVGDAIDLSTDIVGEILKKPHLKSTGSESTRLAHLAKMTGYNEPVRIEDIHLQPCMINKDDDKTIAQDVQVNEDGSVTKQQSSNFIYQCDKSTRFENRQTQLWFSTRTGIKKATLEAK